MLIITPRAGIIWLHAEILQKRTFLEQDGERVVIRKEVRLLKSIASVTQR